MILSCVIKYIYHLVLCICVQQIHKLVFPLNTVSNLHINVLLLGQHVEKIIIIMGVINGQISIIISNIS